MDAGSSIFRADMARMLRDRPQEKTLVGRPIVDPIAVEEANFRLDHGGMTRAQWNEHFAEIRRNDERDALVADTQGEPPECETPGLSPQRSLYARYAAWHLQARKQVEVLEARRAQFEAMIAAPAATEAEIRGVVRRAADRLLGRVQGGDGNGDRKSLGERLESEKYGAEAAQEALPELEGQIENARLRVRKLDEREDEFLGPAIAEVAEAAGLGKLYLKKIAELREIVELILGLSTVAGGYGSGFGNGISCHIQGKARTQAVIAVDFPQTGFKSVSDDNRSYRISGEGRSEPWRQLKQALVLDPFSKAFVPLPKG
jgi:hypothetical protein